MKNKKVRFKEIRSGRYVARIRVINILKICFAPDTKQLKNRSADLKDLTDPVRHYSALLYNMYDGCAQEQVKLKLGGRRRL